MSNPSEDKKTNIILAALGVIPVVWAALMVAPFLSDGLAGIIEGFTSGMADPMEVKWCVDSLKAILIFLLIYGLGIGVYLSTKRNYRKGEEHGSAKWGNASQESQRPRMWRQRRGQDSFLCQTEHHASQYFIRCPRPERRDTP